MKRPLVLVALALVVIVVGALAVWLVFGGTQLGASRDLQDEIDQIPLYPGAKQIGKVGAEHTRAWRAIQYDVHAEATEVATFYSEELSRLGWRPDAAMQFYKVQDSKDRHYDLSVSLDVYNNQSNTGAVGRTRVWIVLVRVPHLDNIPVPPEATGVQRDGYLTAYQMAGTVGDVREFYLARLYDHGWRGSPPVIDAAPGEKLPLTLNFVATNGTQSQATLQVNAERAQDGTLNVSIRVEGGPLLAER